MSDSTCSLLAQVSNLLNHVQLNDPSLDINNPAAWGVISGQFNAPRAIEFGLPLPLLTSSGESSQTRHKKTEEGQH